MHIAVEKVGMSLSTISFYGIVLHYLSSLNNREGTCCWLSAHCTLVYTRCLQTLACLMPAMRCCLDGPTMCGLWCRQAEQGMASSGSGRLRRASQAPRGWVSSGPCRHKDL